MAEKNWSMIKEDGMVDAPLVKLIFVYDWGSGLLLPQKELLFLSMDKTI